MLRAYGYAGVICAGPMLLGVLLQFGVLIVSSWWQVGRPDRDLLVCMITYTLLASLVLTSFLSMPVTRFLADMLFDHDEKMILPSFWGSTGIMLVVGAVLYTVFLLFSGATLMQGALCLWLFLECDELFDGHQGLQKHSVFFRGCGVGGVRYVMRVACVGLPSCGVAVVRSGAWLWCDAGVGCALVASLFSAKS